uniref:Epidermal growth factor receptor kinase substrate 8-like isoform X1 n=1 Tax=Petromyzon marinus TaxID=7757 RepID=A0AAJ7XHY9_PETMA|nr:epidermal growth factor receptor kinase substrate 8-like isoform X1 [Petromyzon marinus]
MGMCLWGGRGGTSLAEQRKNYARSSNIKAETAQYHVEHLSTFEMDRKEGLVNLEDGIRRLRLLDSTGKIWTQDMLLQVDERSVALVDIESKEELENFTLTSIISCQAVLTEPNYSSILALICTDVGQAKPDLHLFHCVEVGAELIKNDIDSAIADSKDGRKNRRPETLRFNQERMRMSPSPAPGAASVYSESHSPVSNRSRTPNDLSTQDRDSDRFSVYSQESDETPEMMAKRVDRDVQILNHLLDDIELFVARLQKSAEAYGELNKRKKEKKGKRKGEGVLTLRSKPPPPGEFREILQKFKYCFNLLARLKGHIQNPDSTELVHFLFTPLEMVVHSTGGPDLARLITSPLLTRDCIDMLQGCLAAKERELWKSCGDAWNKSKAEWPRDQHVPPYVPRFRSGWEPPLLDVPVRERERERAREHVAELVDGRGPPLAQHHNEPPWMHSEPDGAAHLPNNGYVAFGQPDPYHHGLLPPGDRGFDGSAPPPRSPLGPQTAIVRYDFMARNSNELAVRKDDVVEVIENSKQWWKVRSVTGHEGYVPNNILDLLKGGDGGGMGGMGGGMGGLSDEPLYSRALQRLVGELSEKQRTDSGNRYPGGPASPGLPLPPNGLQRQGSGDSANALGPEPPRSNNNNNNQRDPAQQHVQEELLKRLSGQNVNKRNFMIPRSKGTAVVLSFDSSPEDVKSWLVAKGFSNLTVDSLGVLTGAQIFSLNKEELKAVCPDEGARVYSQITVQKSALESARGTSELEEIMKKRKEKISSVDKNGSEDVTA